MPATDSEFTSMEDPHALENEEGCLTNIPSSVPPAPVPSSTPLVLTTTKPDFTSKAVIMIQAVSMASNDCSSALSSPAEASPAKAAVTLPTTSDETVQTSPATSHIASASESIKCTGMSHVNISESSPSLPALPAATFGSSELKTDFPAVLTFKGISVTLENNSVWRQFNSCGTEMILTKQGRRMFPYCRYRLSGLDPDRQYSLVLSIVPTDQFRYRWNTSKWEVSGPIGLQSQGLIRAFAHHYSPCKGSDWMGGLVSFYKLKLTNNYYDLEGHIILQSMRRYIPRLHVIPVPNENISDQPVVMGPESMTFTFPQTEFMAVTTYQNFRITQLKINYNPFARGFREDGNNSRLIRVTTGAQPVMETETQPSDVKPAEPSEIKEHIVNLSMKNHTVSASPSNEQMPRLVLKPIMSSTANKDEPYVPCIRGKHALGDLVLVQKSPCVEPREETHAISVTPKAQQDFRVMPKAISLTPTSTASTPGSSPGYRKRRKRTNRHWANSRGRECKAATASPTVVHSPSLTVAMQPELDDVEGLLFVSFTSKEALEVHIRDKPTSNSSTSSPLSPTPQMQLKQTVEVTPEADEVSIARLEALLLQDLRFLKHRQAIHPVLQEVGLKLSSLDPTKSIDLQYLGVHLPLPPPNLPEQGNTTSPGDEGLPFISRTGKTSDMTKIKGWKNKFIRSKESSPNCDGPQKNLSAFCSNMLDEYLESEAKSISERAAAFSTDHEGSVAYQLPAKSSSYVKTLDSALKHRNAASKFSVGVNRPCPLSHKPLLYSALTAPAPPLARSVAPVQTQAQSTQQLASGDSIGSVSQRLSTFQPGVSQRSVANSGQSHAMIPRPTGPTQRFLFKLSLMETGALNQGLCKTQLTSDRLSMALSVILTKQMLPSQVLKVAQHPKDKVKEPECGQDFCILGCVCSSLQHLNKSPLHCRRPECMFGCTCFKRKITRQLSEGESEQLIQPVYSMSNMEHVVQPRPGSHANKLWNRNIHDVDPEPLFAPKSAPLCLAPFKVVKRSTVSRPTQPIQEEDKDPVYKYFESMMTCARVREFNSKPPPEVTIVPKILNAVTQNTSAKPQNTTTDHLPTEKYNSALLAVRKAAEKSSLRITSNEAEAKKQIQIQSACQWDKDHKMVLGALCQRMNRNRLSQRFSIGPYCIRPVAKIFMRKPSGSIVTYRVHISKPTKVSDSDEDESDDSDEEKCANKSFDGNIDTEEESGQIEEPEMRIGVTPFLSGVLPAGKMRARTKPAGCQAYGLIQVNGKSYNQARLLLGNMGSLHPANRLAAYVTGRLHTPADVSLANSQKSDPPHKINTPGFLHIKPASTAIPTIINARKTSELNTPAQPPAQQSQHDFWKKASITIQQHLQNSSITSPIQTFVSGQRSSFQNSSASSPVSLTVSPSLKTPSFLGQSGTYSFRICPPANQGSRDQKLPGVPLPGGFTLIQLPKPGADGAAQQSESGNAANLAGMEKDRPPKDALFKSGHLAADKHAKLLGLDILTEAKDLSSCKSVELGSSTELMCDEKMPSDESDEASSRQADSNSDIASEDSDSSDYGGEDDEDEEDEDVDVETVEEASQGMDIAEMKEYVRRALQDPRDDFESARELSFQDQMDDKSDESKDKRRRKNHVVLERQRRSQQRSLFNRLQTVLQSYPGTPKLLLLSLALKEIQSLVETSKYLEEKKRRLTHMQSVYVKELSLLSGKSDKMIKHKLKEIWQRQKMREKKMKLEPVYSHLLQSRAAALQSSAPDSKVRPTPLLQPDFNMAPFQANSHTTAAHNMPDQPPMPTPHPLPLAASSPAPAEITASSLQAEKQPKASSVKATPPVTAGQDGTSPTSTPNSNNTSGHTQQALTLPLIRSKTGRIILPSSLKPIGQGYYTIMVMNRKDKEEEDEVNMDPSDMVPSKYRMKSFSESDHHSDSESRPLLEEDKTVQSSQPKRSDVAVLLAERVLLNKSISVPSVALKFVESSPEGGAGVGLNKPLAAAHASLNHVEAEPDTSPPVVRRGRGRPRKNPIPPVGQKGKRIVVKDLIENMNLRKKFLQVQERRRKKMALQVAKDTPLMVDGEQVPVKRGRGRPRKDKSAQLYSPQDMRTGRSPTPTTLLGSMNTARPLTRGALGKDFPSAKKRSWIDIEKELEPEVVSE